jgi:hypothetical protein
VTKPLLDGAVLRYDGAMSTTEQLLDIEATRREWLAALDALLADVTRWSEEQGWQVEAEEKEIREQRLGAYATRKLTVTTPAGKLVIDPIARSVYVAEGRVDMYAWATYNRVVLERRRGEWVVRTESNIDWPLPWSRETFLDLAGRLLGSR